MCFSVPPTDCIRKHNMMCFSVPPTDSIRQRCVMRFSVPPTYCIRPHCVMCFSVSPTDCIRKHNIMCFSVPPTGCIRPHCVMCFSVSPTDSIRQRCVTLIPIKYKHNFGARDSKSHQFFCYNTKLSWREFAEQNCVPVKETAASYLSTSFGCHIQGKRHLNMQLFITEIMFCSKCECWTKHVATYRNKRQVMFLVHLIKFAMQQPAHCTGTKRFQVNF